jgi:hypothetical protein
MTEPILGYDKDDQPIHELKRGYIYTAACIFCCKCRTIILGSGGPKHGSTCVLCHEAKLKELNI